MDSTQVRNKTINVLSSKFQALSLDKRYEYLEGLGLPAFIVQSVDIDDEPLPAASSVFDYISVNAPEYLEKLPGFIVPSRE